MGTSPIRRFGLLAAVLVLVGGMVLSSDGPVQAHGTESSLHDITPCRIVDTRQPGTSPGQTGKFSNGELRIFDVWGPAGAPYFTDQGGVGCDLPDPLAAVEFTFTAVSAGGNGYMRAWPAALGSSAAGATVLNSTNVFNASNSVTVGVAGNSYGDFSGELMVRNLGPSTHLVIDITAYYH